VAADAKHTRCERDVEDGVKDLSQGMHSWSSGSFRDGDQRLYAGPFGIGEVGLVCSSHARYSTELLSQDPFSDSFRRGFLGSSPKLGIMASYSRWKGFGPY
jgi:hypothetical protein